MNGDDRPLRKSHLVTIDDVRQLVKKITDHPDVALATLDSRPIRLPQWRDEDDVHKAAEAYALQEDHHE